MFLSEFQVNLGRRAAREMISSPQLIHAAVLGCFPPGASSSDAARTLWRMDQADHAPKLFISSPIQPDFSALAEKAGWSNGGARSARYDEFLEDLTDGQSWRFRLTANPTVSVKDANRPLERGRRLSHVTATQQSEWLSVRAQRLGIILSDGDSPTFRLTQRGTRQFTKQGGRHKVTIATAQFDGTLRVADAPRLRDALMNGIGGARAYGCGLMTLAPIGG